MGETKSPKPLDNLRMLRKQRGLNQKELADVLGLQPAALSKYENGSNEPGIGMLKSMANFFGVSVDYIIGITDETTPSARPEPFEKGCDYIYLAAELGPWQKHKIPAYATARFRALIKAGLADIKELELDL